jgi:Uma2 family endonuclease
MSDSVTPIGAPMMEYYEPKRFTVADLELLPTELPSGPVLYELHHGRLITMCPPGDIHGGVETKVASALLTQGEDKGHGKARSGEVGIILARNPDHILLADALFVTNKRLPIRRSPEGYLDTIPELVVEIRSKNDTLVGLARKAEEYLQAGTMVVWVVDPISRNVVEYRTGVEPRTYSEDDTLTVADLIPGFQLAVRRALQE